MARVYFRCSCVSSMSFDWCFLKTVWWASKVLVWRGVSFSWCLAGGFLCVAVWDRNYLSRSNLYSCLVWREFCGISLLAIFFSIFLSIVYEFCNWFSFLVLTRLENLCLRASRPSGALVAKDAYCVRLYLKNVASQSSFSTEHNFSSLSTH